MVPTFSSFAAIDNKGHFRKNLTGFSSLAVFLVAMPTFLKKWVRYLIQNLMLNRLAPVSNPKNEKVKRSKTLVCPFLVALFHFETSLIKVFPFSETILDSGKFLPSWSEAKKLAGSDKKNYFTYQPRSKCTFLLYRHKI